MPAVAYVSDQSAVEVHDSLRSSLATADEAQQCAVLWFAEVKRRRLYRELGFSSIYQYAMEVRAAVADGKLGYTKARAVVDVATPETEDRWLKVAEGPRGNLVKEVKKVKRAARVDPDQGELLLEALAALVEAGEAKRESDNTDSHAKKGPGGPRTSRPPVQIHVHEDAASGRVTVQTDAGERELGRADAERMRCDAAVSQPDRRNTSTIPPRTRREVLARDHHRCTAPGCGRTRFLEVHHLTPRQNGGTNHAENLTTLCSACHRLWHERPGVMPPEL